MGVKKLDNLIISGFFDADFLDVLGLFHKIDSFCNFRRYYLRDLGVSEFCLVKEVSVLIDETGAYNLIDVVAFVLDEFVFVELTEEV